MINKSNGPNIARIKIFTDSLAWKKSFSYQCIKHNCTQICSVRNEVMLDFAVNTVDNYIPDPCDETRSSYSRTEQTYVFPAGGTTLIIFTGLGTRIKGSCSPSPRCYEWWHWCEVLAPVLRQTDTEKRRRHN
jgi:hypothetical protein